MVFEFDGVSFSGFDDVFRDVVRVGSPLSAAEPSAADDVDEPAVSAVAVAQPNPITTADPMPRATAKPPTRPTCIVDPICHI